MIVAYFEFIVLSHNFRTTLRFNVWLYHSWKVSLCVKENKEVEDNLPQIVHLQDHNKIDDTKSDSEE